MLFRHTQKLERHNLKKNKKHTPKDVAKKFTKKGKKVAPQKRKKKEAQPQNN